ncbi:MAG: LPXTG cell wall anchor domain-containing protein [Peptococcaceae bacterium]
MSKHGFYHRWGKRCVALLVCLSLLVQPFAAYADEIVAYSHGSEAVVREDLPQDTEEARAYMEDHRAPHVYEDGVIKIYNAVQLEKIGSGQPVTDTDDEADAFGEGTAVSENGTVVEYAMDGRYQLMNDIELDADALWQLPVGFTGTFVNEPCDDDATLYDPDKDTIYVYHSYQLQTIASSDGDKAPVMSKDALADQYGIGKLVYPDGSLGKVPPEEAQDYLTYSKEHRYVLSKQFTEATPTLQSAQYFAADQPKAKAGTKANAKAALTPEEIQLGGRKHVGQVYTTIDNEKYILIGNEQQLQAVGSGKHVTPMLFVKVTVTRLLGHDEQFIVPYYPGDADFNLRLFSKANISHTTSEFPKDEFLYYKDSSNKSDDLMNQDLSEDGLLGKLTAGLGGLLGGLIAGLLGAPKYALVGLKNENTAQASIGVSEYTTHDELKQTYNNIKYDTDQNYIVFRDIDCKDMDWQPIHLSGSMEGRLNMEPGVVPTIRNVTVNKTGDLDVEHDYGIGFFGSLRSGMDEKTFLHKKTVVKNLSIDGISVTNSSNKVAPHADSLIDGLLQILGGLVGGVLDLLTPILGVKLGDVITGLLTLRQNSEDIFATGSFVGSIKGNVHIENCSVKNAEVSSVKGLCGGFAGYSEGVEEYDGLSKLLGGTVKLLSALLNIIPGVGLGDLITVLLENDAALGKLIPTGYDRPMFSDCSVALKEGTAIGSPTEKYNGGFIGAQLSSEMKNCSVSGLSKVQALNGAGGFAGIARDDNIVGALSDLVGVELVDFDIRSTQTNCTVQGSQLHIETVVDANGKNGDYAGGFNGAMNCSTSTNCAVSGLAAVSANNYAGGFAGRATIGYGTTIGEKDSKNNTLLGNVGGLLAGLTSGDAKMEALLSITGNKPSILSQCQVEGVAHSADAPTKSLKTSFGVNKLSPMAKQAADTTSNNGLTITASKDYAGGLIGAGDGVQVDADATSAAAASSVTKVQSVEADNYAGGIAGAVSTANPIGVLNNTLGVGKYLGPRLKYTTVEGDNWHVQATHKAAAGGIGLMVGGELDNIQIKGLSTVEAGNYAGGVIGRAGTGGLAKEKGLDLLGLGLIKVNNVLSLAQGVAVTAKQIHLQGQGATVQDKGLVVTANGNADITDSESICAGGFVSEAEGVDMTDCVVSNLQAVTANAQTSAKKSYAGGFIGRSHTGGLAGLAQESSDGKLNLLPGILDVGSLLKVTPYLLPTYNACKVHFVSNGTQKAAPEASAGDATNGEVSSQNKGETSGEAKPLFEVLNANADVSAQKETAKAPEKDEAAIHEDSTVHKDNASTEKTVPQAANPQVKADIAGGFVGWMQSGEINGKKTSTPPSTETPAPEPTPNEQQPQNGTAKKAASKAEASSVTSPSTEQASGEKPADSKPSGDQAPAKDATAPKVAEKTYCVEGLEAVEGRDYAGGFAGQVEAGAAASSDGLTLLGGIKGLNLDLSSLLNVLNVYIPTINDAGVHGVEGKGEGALVGYTVKATAKDSVAGGYAGAMSGARVNRSDVKSLRSTMVTPPKDGLESKNGDSYFDDAQSTYAVTAGKYAGGYVGSADIDSAAKAGGGLSLLGGALQLDSVLSAVDAVATKISDSDVYGAPGGFSVRANGTDQKDIVRGMAGGFVGRSSGSQMTNSNVNNFNYIIGQETAGGYAGMMEPGNVASVIEDTGVLGGLLNVQETVASLVNSFIPIVKDSSTTCVPCGGGVRAQGATNADLSRGMAGGYVGYNHGGRILGETKECAAVRIRSVYGHEFAGGFTGLMETADIAGTGNLSVLYGLLKLSNVLGLLSTVYPTETKTAVYGPLRQIDMDTWNNWVKYVGQNGNYGNQLPQTPVTTQDELNALIKKYAYGYNVVAGRDQAGAQAHQAGCAGGYVGRMKSGVVTEAHAWDPKSVVAHEGAGGFAGEMLTGGVASVGSLNLLDLPIVGSLDAVQTFVPVVRNSDVTGFQSGLTVHATGVPQPQGTAKVEKVGDAGGFVGRMVGGQIWGEWDDPNAEKPAPTKTTTTTQKNEETQTTSSNQKNEAADAGNDSSKDSKPTADAAKDTKAKAPADTTKAEKNEGSADAQSNNEAASEASKGEADAAQTPAPAYATDAVPDAANNRCFVDNLRWVDGKRTVGGFAGLIEPGSAASLDTASSEGLLGGLLQHVIGTPGDLLKVLNATVSTVKACDVKAWHDYGIVVNGIYNEPNNTNTQYAKAVGGFVGESDGAVFGKLKDDSQTPKYGTSVQCLRSVTGGEHVGGYFGLADVSAVAQVSDGKTGILEQLVTLGSTDILDGFRTYVYDGAVSGAKVAGLEVNAKEGKRSEYVNDPVYTGNAGGFGGSLLNGSVKRSDVTGLRQVNGLNYTGGFVGHLGKSGTVDLDNLGILDKVVGVGAGVMDIFGSHVEDSTVTGMNGGFTVASRNGAKEKEEISGGFVGMADLAKLKNDQVNDLKQVASGTTAGGFAGKTDFEYLIKLEGDSWLINQLVDLLNKLLKALWVETLEAGKTIKINLGIITVDALYDGNLVHVNLLGLDIAIALSKKEQLATIHIGDSKITVNGIQNDGSLAPGSAQKFKNEIQLSLIKANRTRIDHCQVTGVPIGYDVYGAGADNYNNGTNTKGHAGGFVGWNNEGLLKGNDMFYADVVRGVEKTTAPFSGFSILESNWNFNKLFGIEGDHNNYRIYREFGQAFDDIVKAPGGTPLQDAFQSTGTWDNIFKIVHMTENKVEKFTDLKGAQATSETETKPLDAYMENGAKALLMNDTPTTPTPIPENELLPPDMQDPCSDLVNLTIEKRWKGDNPDKRPESITLTITRTYEENGKVVQDPSFNETVTMTKADYQSEDVWQKVLSSPNYTAYRVGTDGTTKYYYTYHVSEEALEGYDTTIKYNDTYHYSTTITNGYKFLGGLLPETGGGGIGWLMLAGLLLVAAGYIAKRRRQHHERRAAS